MTYAIFYKGSNMVARDAQGNYHIYENKELAEKIAKDLGDGYEVKPF